jgi:CRISPR-associated endoribonuclease Cas6
MESPLYSLALSLQPERAGTLPATSGHQAHAAFLDAIKKADPDLAELLHAPNQPARPFTVSPLFGARADRGETLEVSPERPCTLRVTLLQGALYRELMRRFLEDPGRPALRLGSMSFLVTQVQSTPGSSPWAGYTSWEALREQARPEERVALEFLTPTAFSLGQRPWGKQFHVLPEARFVFGSLLRSWNAFAPAGLAMEAAPLEQYLENDAVILEINGLRTVMWRYPRHLQVGFTGRVSYGFKGKDEALRRQLNALADFAFYAGVGYKTTMGMGQARRIVRGRQGDEVKESGAGHE